MFLIINKVVSTRRKGTGHVTIIETAAAFEADRTPITASTIFWITLGLLCIEGTAVGSLVVDVGVGFGAHT